MRCSKLSCGLEYKLNGEGAWNHWQSSAEDVDHSHRSAAPTPSPLLSSEYEPRMEEDVYGSSATEDDHASESGDGDGWEESGDDDSNDDSEEEQEITLSIMAEQVHASWRLVVVVVVSGSSSFVTFANIFL